MVYSLKRRLLLYLAKWGDPFLSTPFRFVFFISMVFFCLHTKDASPQSIYPETFVECLNEQPVIKEPTGKLFRWQVGLSALVTPDHVAASYRYESDPEQLSLTIDDKMFLPGVGFSVSLTTLSDKSMFHLTDTCLELFVLHREGTITAFASDPSHAGDGEWKMEYNCQYNDVTLSIRFPLNFLNTSKELFFLRCGPFAGMNQLTFDGSVSEAKFMYGADIECGSFLLFRGKFYVTGSVLFRIKPVQSFSFPCQYTQTFSPREDEFEIDVGQYFSATLTCNLGYTY